MYSHFAKNMWGETMAPQRHDYAPWIDEVQQTVAVNNNLNGVNGQNPYCPAGPTSPIDKSVCKPYYIHQAGAYQEDPSYTDTPFFSPSLAKHCSGNSCTFASWGTHAHVGASPNQGTPFTSPIILISKYTNCGDGIIEYTQVIHK